MCLRRFCLIRLGIVVMKIPCFETPTYFSCVGCVNKYLESLTGAEGKVQDTPSLQKCKSALFSEICVTTTIASEATVFIFHNAVSQ